jgi:septal ring factor EnvC (AmiA/AmiB activator)
MPLPILAWLAFGGLGGVIVKTIHDMGHSSGKKEGYNEGVEESAARINDLTKKLSELQERRENLKEKLSEVVSNIGDLDIKDQGFFAKIAALLRGYTNFHTFILAVISYSRYRILELSLDNSRADELKTIVIGLVQGGFPDNLKRDINRIWESVQKPVVAREMKRYQSRLKSTLQIEFNSVTSKIDDIVKGIIEINATEFNIEQELRVLQAA